MPHLFNIFPSKKENKLRVKLIDKPKILADYREKNSLVFSELVSLGMEVEFKELKVADYLTKGVAIERKTVSDFINSMLNHRLLRQLEELQQYKKRLLIIEGIDEQELYSSNKNYQELTGVNPNAIRGFLLSILLKYNVPIIFSKNYQDTARFIAILARKQAKEIPLNVSKKSLSKKERLQFILEGFPGIGPKTAKKLLEHFKTLKAIINTPLTELQNLIGKKADIFRLLEENY